MKDFIDFQFCGVRASSLNLLRVSDGSRYSETLIPSFQDKTATITGGDGTLYWESFYTTRTWSISVAFDKVSETQMRTIRNLFTAKNMGELIFDERPFKVYTAKVQSTPTFKTLCFMENGARVYKGEGTIQFISYTPYAHQKYKYLSSYLISDYPNRDEWSDSSGMLLNQDNYDQIQTPESGGSLVELYNAGDVDTDWQATFNLDTASGRSNLTQVYITQNGTTLHRMEFSEITRQNSNDVKIRLDSRTQLIEGIKSDGTASGSLYNRFITAGDFFKIPVAKNSQGIPASTFYSNTACSDFTYNYLYY